MIIALAPTAPPERRARPAFGQEAAPPSAKAPYRDPTDEPCRPGPPLFAGGPPFPAHAWRELRGEPATASQRAYLRRLGIADAPRDKDQAGQWIDQALKWKALVP